MIRYLIKNNLKMMIRSKWTIVVMILGPILVSAVLSSAFQDLMKSYEGVEEFTVGYRVEDDVMQDKITKDGIEQIKEAARDAGIVLVEYPEGEAEELMNHNDLAGFVEIGAEKYTVYESEDYIVEGITLEYFCNQIMNQGMEQTLLQVVPGIQEEEVELPVQQLEFMPAINATDYYGIIEIVYFIWCGFVCAAAVLASEKKNGIHRKYQVSSISNMKLYLGKWIPIVLTIVVEIGIALVTTVLVLGIHWGNPLFSAILIVVSAMASAAFGLMLYYFFWNLAVTIIVLFTSVWFMGFIGGSFETYMFSSWPIEIKNLSPLYHVNRALVEYSCMGESTYTKGAILYMLAITVICSMLAIVVEGMRKRGKA